MDCLRSLYFAFQRVYAGLKRWLDSEAIYGLRAEIFAAKRSMNCWTFVSKARVGLFRAFARVQTVARCAQ